MTDQIVVGMDGSAGAAEALRWAVREGRRRGWGVTAVLAWTFLAQHRADRSDEFDPEYAESDAAEALESYVREAVGDDGAAAITKEVVCDAVAPALLAEADGERLLVVASRGLGGFRGLLVGSTSQQCVHHATVPVAIVRSGVADADGDAASRPERVVVGVDGSEMSIHALQWAIDQARASGGSVDVVHSWIAPFAYGFPAAVPLDPIAYARAAELVAGEVIASCDTSGVPVTPHTVTGGSIAGALLEHAEGADLVVVGSRGVGGFRGMLLGSVAHHVTQHASCPVVVVPEAGRDGGGAHARGRAETEVA